MPDFNVTTIIIVLAGVISLALGLYKKLKEELKDTFMTKDQCHMDCHKCRNEIYSVLNQKANTKDIDILSAKIDNISNNFNTSLLQISNQIADLSAKIELIIEGKIKVE